MEATMSHIFEKPSASIEQPSFSNIKMKNVIFLPKYQASTKNLVFQKYYVFRW